MKCTVPAITAALLIPAGAALTQTTGTSHPEALNDVVVTSSAQTSTHYVKPSPAIQANTGAATLKTREYAVTTPMTTTAATQTTVTIPVATQPTTASVRRDSDEDQFVVTDDPNSGVVTEVEWRPNEVPEGTLLRARLSTEISTSDTEVGAPFRATLTHPVEHRGRIILPVGTVLSGRVSDLHEGHRISGAALIHLEPELITLPDGTTHRLVSPGRRPEAFPGNPYQRRGHDRWQRSQQGNASGARPHNGQRCRCRRSDRRRCRCGCRRKRGSRRWRNLVAEARNASDASSRNGCDLRVEPANGDRRLQ